MEIFASQLRARAKSLELSNAEIARRLGISERRYAHYVIGDREPDLALLVQISLALGCTPNDLLGIGEIHQPVWRQKLEGALAEANDRDRQLIAEIADTVARLDPPA